MVGGTRSICILGAIRSLKSRLSPVSFLDGTFLRQGRRFSASKNDKTKLNNLPKVRVGRWQMGLSTPKPMSFPCCHLKGHKRRFQPWYEIT